MIIFRFSSLHLQVDSVYHGKVLQVGVSIGVYFIDDANESLDSILKAADSAMYMAKSSGKGRYILVDRESLKKIDL
ncbi:diguanylate cyclase [Vibrio sp. SA48]